MDKSQWYQPSTPARYTQSGWVKLYPESRVKNTDKKTSCLLVLSVISITLASLLIVLGYFL